MIIKKLTGKKYYDVMKERILKHFNLVNTHASDRTKITWAGAGVCRRKK